jgi:hypothetical protein
MQYSYLLQLARLYIFLSPALYFSNGETTPWRGEDYDRFAAGKYGWNVGMASLASDFTVAALRPSL